MDSNYESKSMIHMILRAVRASAEKKGFEARPEYIQELEQMWGDMRERNRSDLIEVKMPEKEAQDLLDELNDLIRLAEGYTVTEKFAALLKELIEGDTYA